MRTSKRNTRVHFRHRPKVHDGQDGCAHISNEPAIGAAGDHIGALFRQPMRGPWDQACIALLSTQRQSGVKPPHSISDPAQRCKSPTKLQCAADIRKGSFFVDGFIITG